MIIAVNISKALKEGKTLLEATDKAWDLDIIKCREHDFVLGVERGQIKACFIILDIFPDQENEDRVAFKLKPCCEGTDNMIRNHIRDNDINLGGVQRGKYI